MLDARPCRLFRPPAAAALLALALSALLGAALARPSRAEVVPLLVPGVPDSGVVDPPAGPLIVPGRGPHGTLPKTNAARARDSYVLGRALERQGQPASAIVSYHTATMLDSSLRDAHLRMGILFARVGQHRVAAREFAAELTLDPGNSAAGRALGLSLAAIGDTVRAIQQLELLTRRDPRDEASWQALGFAYGAANRNADAEKALRRALQLEPKDADAWRDLGALYANTGRGKAARDAYLKAIELDPTDARVLVNLGNLERRDQHSAAALAAYHQAELRDSTLGFAYRGQVDVLMELQRDADAGAVYRRWLKAMPDESTARLEAMALFTRLGRTDVALEMGRDGVRREARSGEPHLALGMAYHAAGQEADALGEMRRAQLLLKKPEQRKRVEQMIAGLRAAAPDSLRALFAADSVAHMRPAAADSAAGSAAGSARGSAVGGAPAGGARKP